jgi:outer membrane receptor protein involved in Fe transport
MTIVAALGQTPVSITGQVFDEQAQPVPFANAALYSQADSMLITGAVSDDNGNFIIAASHGAYYLKITFLSYEEKTISPVNVAGADISLGKIVLKSGAQVLESVTVQGEKSQMELHLDKRVFQVGKDLSSISGSAAEILDNVPSVNVDVEGNISLRGSQNVRILIDGRPSGLTGISTADALRQLQGNLIERIEVITNPSARYDAEGEVGIINIILKKERQKGVNGSFTVNTGYPDNHGAAFNMNFRRKNLNFFSSYGFSYRSNPGRGTSFQSFDLNNPTDTAFYYRQRNERTRSDRSHNLQIGTDYFFDNNSILTASFVLRRSNGLNKSTNIYEDYDEDNTLIGTSIRNEREEEPEINSEIAVSYRREYAKKGQQLSADFKWIENIETEKSTYEQGIASQDEALFDRSRNTEDERNALIQVDYTHPYSSKGKMEMGLKSTLRVIDNEFRVERLDQASTVWNVLDEFDNHLVYTENIHAGYFIIGNEINKFSWQGGLRGELSDIKVEMLKDDDLTFQNYFNLFPSLHLSYSIKPEKTVQLSYSYRLSRPRFRDLMPFSNYSDNRAIQIGNPNLRPEYTSSVEAGYLINWASGSLLSSVYYRYRTGVFERIPIVSSDTAGFTSSQAVNLSTQDAFGLEVTFTWNPVKWWRFNTNANFYRAITEGSYNELDYFSDTYTSTGRATSRFTVLKSFDLQGSVNYRGPRITPQGEDKAITFVDLGASRDILKGNGTITLAVRDLFNSRKFRNIIDRPGEGYYAENEFQGRRRQLLLTINYRLNRKKDSGPRDRDGGESDGGEGDF